MVFPAYAGMFRCHEMDVYPRMGFPRIRGDVPYTVFVSPLKFWFSPHTRGCSDQGAGTHGIPGVFPAYAGMFRKPSCSLSNSNSFPRIRGDVPLKSGNPYSGGKFSPHTRGCSATTHTYLYLPQVFPAYAGMFLLRTPPGCPPPSFPRIRGDVPSR